MDVENSMADRLSLTQSGTIKIWAIRGAIVVLLAVCAVYGFQKISYAVAHEGTDDAFISGTIVPISPEIKGKVIKVLVNDNQIVKAGDVLLEIAPDDLSSLVQARQESVLRLTAEEQEIRAAIQVRSMGLARARADLEAARTSASLAEKELRRSEELRKKEFISQSDFDRAESNWKAVSARSVSAEAAVGETEAGIAALNAQLVTQNHKIREAGSALELARLDLNRAVITAPLAGRIAKKNVDEGKYVQPGQPLLSIVDDSGLWVEANFKETQIAHMRPGQPVDIIVDAYPGVSFRGHVDSFQPGTGAVFSLLPPQNATGNFVKVVQRVPVKIVIDSKPDPLHPLWPGLSVYPSVTVRNGARP